MTRRDLDKILAKWLARLPLDDWTVEIKVEPCDSFANAQVYLPRDYHDAEIRISSDFAKWDTREANRVIVHELMHVVLRDLDSVAVQAAALLGGQAESLSRAAWLHVEEGLVEQMAQRLADW
jgi:hypothetical protein